MNFFLYSYFQICFFRPPGLHSPMPHSDFGWPLRSPARNHCTSVQKQNSTLIWEIHSSVVSALVSSVTVAWGVIRFGNYIHGACPTFSNGRASFAGTLEKETHRNWRKTGTDNFPQPQIVNSWVQHEIYSILAIFCCLSDVESSICWGLCITSWQPQTYIFDYSTWISSIQLFISSSISVLFADPF